MISASLDMRQVQSETATSPEPFEKQRYPKRLQKCPHQWHRRCDRYTPQHPPHVDDLHHVSDKPTTRRLRRILHKPAWRRLLHKPAWRRIRTQFAPWLLGAPLPHQTHHHVPLVRCPNRRQHPPWSQPHPCPPTVTPVACTCTQTQPPTSGRAHRTTATSPAT